MGKRAREEKKAAARAQGAEAGKPERKAQKLGSWHPKATLVKGAQVPPAPRSQELGGFPRGRGADLSRREQVDKDAPISLCLFYQVSPPLFPLLSPS